MKLDTEFIRLPLSFDVERLREEVGQFDESDWRPHPQGHPGNSALPLIAAGGNPNDDAVKGRMEPTPHLERCEYIRQVLAGLETVLGRARLMRIDGNAEATLHVDTNYYWVERLRVHIPIVTSPAIEFLCGERSLHMPAGEAWVFDAWRNHNVLNPTGERRIHLVADTVGSSRFWQLVEAGERPFAGKGSPVDTRHIPHGAGDAVSLDFEHVNFPVVMAPWEQERLAGMIVDDAAAVNGSAEELRGVLDPLLRDWRATWARHGADPSGFAAYAGLLERAERATAPLEGRFGLENGSDAVEIVRQWLIRPALNPDLAQRAPAVVAAERRPAALRSRLRRPIFIVAPPRSGTTLLFETLARSPSVCTIGDESHGVFEGIPDLHPANRGWDSNRLTATDARPQIVQRLHDTFTAALKDRDGSPPPDGSEPIRMLEKTPKNALRVPFLNAAFPEAHFIYVYREPRESLSSMINAWKSGRFVTYPQLPEWPGPPWSLLLVPEWRKLKGASLPEIVTQQWEMATRVLLADLERLPPERWSVVAYHALIADPQREIERLCELTGIEWDESLDAEGLPPSRYTLTPPDPEKWKEHAVELEDLLPRTVELAERGRELIARPLSLRPRFKDAPTDGSPFRSVSTPALSEVLRQLSASLLVTTYQTGRLVCVRRAEEGINTHFRGFDSPMGLAWAGHRLAVGTGSQVWEYQNVPQVAAKVDVAGRHDACFVPRRAHWTGDVRVHDIAYADGELWIVATRFSCLATLDDQHSFVPQWRPPFVTKLAAEDRCHLNGLAVVDDRVRFVTALGVSDEPGGWREQKARGGVLIDVDSGEVAVSGLSMPHSPRWHRDRLWLLESGEGTLAAVDLDTGKVETVAELPGFTRGLSFAGPIAFVGLSEVREATTFGGLPLTGRLEERQCGVWMVNIETAETIGFLRFEELVQEIFDVAILPGIAFPEIAEHGSEAAKLSYVVPDATQ